MLTSRMFAPPRTCSSATSTAPVKSSASISRRKRAEPVTFVRSPISTKPVSGPISNGSSPLQRGRRRGSATVRGARRLDRGARSRACARASSRSSCPTMLRKPGRGELAEAASSSPRASRRSRRTRSAGRRSGGSATRHGASARELGDVRPHLLRAERAVDADDERLGVLDRDPERLDRLARRACGPRGRRSWPRSRAAASGAVSRAAAIAALAFSVSKIVSSSSRSTPPSTSAGDLLRVGRLDLVEGVRAERRVVDASG